MTFKIKTQAESPGGASIQGDTGWPALTLPSEEADVLRRHYDSASVILEYGSGGSTAYAAGLPETLCISVESDRKWAQNLQYKIDQNHPDHQVIVYHTNIGPVGAWGRPLHDHFWQYFFRYPVQIWTEPFFRAPDVVLVDGRFRPACVLVTCLLTAKPLTLLFDDYYNRPAYSQIEKVLKPSRRIGRMAIFEIEKVDVNPEIMSLLMETSNQATFPISGAKTTSYKIGPDNRPRHYGGDPDAAVRKL